MPEVLEREELDFLPAERPNPVQRLLGSRSWRSREGDRAPLGDRLRAAFLKPAQPGAATVDDEEPQSVEELESAVKSANDKERLVGLLAAPWAAGIGLLVVDTLINHDPAARLANGQINRLHVSISLYHDALIALLALAFVMLVTAWFRKRLYLGIVMALYGLTIFNLHYWGFGIPFVMAGAWLLVRSYRLQRDLREATGAVPDRSGGSRRTRSSSGRPGASKRYTPPTTRARSR